MQEACYCGRTGEVEDREPVLDGKGKRALRCPECGHVDDLRWLYEQVGRLLWDESTRQRGALADELRPAA